MHACMVQVYDACMHGFLVQLQDFFSGSISLCWCSAGEAVRVQCRVLPLLA